VVSLFCRHHRFTADCPICSRGTVLDSRTGTPARAPLERTPAAPAPRSRGGGAGPKPPHGAAVYRGRYGAAGPYEREGVGYEVRLERVPGGLRLAEWSGTGLERRAPVLAAGDFAALVEAAAEAGALEGEEHGALAGALGEEPGGGGPEEVDYGASPGRSGELREELRVERLDGDRARLARWVLRPGTGWDMLDAPTMLPARRYAEALRDAVRRGVITP
jgi:hypothetical protein